MQNSLYVQLLRSAFSYIGGVTARHSSEREPSFAAWYKEWNYGTFADGATYIRQAGHHDSRWALAHILVMAALCNRTGHYIFALWFLLSSIFFFPRRISAVADWMSTILPQSTRDMVWP